MFAAGSLPDNPALLKAMVSAQQAEIEHLKLIIAKFRRMQFGRRSEQMDDAIAQLELSLEELECIRAEQEASDKTAALCAQAGEITPAEPGHKPLSDHLPRESVEHLPSDDCCPDCGGALKTKTGRLWTDVRDDRPAGDDSPPAVFAYSPNRRGVHPQSHLKSFKGVLQADAYGGFDALYADGAIREAACGACATQVL